MGLTRPCRASPAIHILFGIKGYVTKIRGVFMTFQFTISGHANWPAETAADYSTNQFIEQRAVEAALNAAIASLKASSLEVTSAYGTGMTGPLYVLSIGTRA